MKRDSKFSGSGTNINQVKKLNAQSGMSYNEVKELLAKEMVRNKLQNHQDLKGKEDFQAD